MVLPKDVVDRAYEVYKSLKDENSTLKKVDSSLIDEIARIDINNLTPVQALVELDKIVRRCRSTKG